MRIKELILETNSLHKTRLFYHKTLELGILEETEDSISFKAGRSVLTFKETTGSKPFYHFAFNITVNKFSDSFEWIDSKLDILPANNNKPIAGYSNWNAQSFYFHDNNANIVEFIVRFDLPYHSPAPFSTDCLEEISEIGIVVSNVKNTAQQLHQQFNIPYFSKGPQLSDFTVLGDDHGLLLITQLKRGWVPTNKPAQSFPITIVDDQGNKISFL